MGGTAFRSLLSCRCRIIAKKGRRRCARQFRENSPTTRANPFSPSHFRRREVLYRNVAFARSAVAATSVVGMHRAGPRKRRTSMPPHSKRLAEVGIHSSPTTPPQKPCSCKALKAPLAQSTLFFNAPWRTPPPPTGAPSAKPTFSSPWTPCPGSPG